MSEPILREECDRKHAEVMQAITDLSNRLYRDNGHLSIQSRLSRLENYYRVQLWVLGGIVAVWMGEVVPKIVRGIGAMQ